MSKYDYPNTCPKCGAKPWTSCRTLPNAQRPGRATDTHRARIDAQHDNPRFRPIHEVLREVYGSGAMVVSCAYAMSRDWEKYVERSKRYDPDDPERVEAALFHEVHNAIWMMFPGGSTAEHAAEKVKANLIEANLWSSE